MRVVIIGHTVGVKYCIEQLLGGSHEVVAVFTHPMEMHLNDLRIFEKRKDKFGSYAYNVFEVTKDFGIPVIEYNELGSEEGINLFLNYLPDVIVTVGCRDILKREFIEAFRYVINLHPFNLPFFRGAGIDSWMILQGYSGTTQHSTCHFINPKIDAGNIICTKEYTIPPNASPLDIFKSRIVTLGPLLSEALTLLELGSVGVPQTESLSRYYPRLNTLRDGRIDFINFKGPEISRFVRAFSYPYDGAYFLYEDVKVHCLSTKFIEDVNVHPYSYGLIFKKSESEIFVFCAGGYVVLSDIEFNLSNYHLGRER